MQARLAGMTGDQIRNLSQEEFQELFSELGAELEAQASPSRAAAVHPRRAAASIPIACSVVVEDVQMGDEDDEY